MNEIKNNSAFLNLLTPLFNYFSENYLRYYSVETRVRFLIDVWDALNDLNIRNPRTNNGIWGWHNVFAASFLNSKHRFSLLIDIIRNEEEAIQLKYIFALRGYYPVLKKSTSY